MNNDEILLGFSDSCPSQIDCSHKSLQHKAQYVRLRSLNSFLNEKKKRFSTPSGSMTDFILAPKARHRAKDIEMEEKEKSV